MRSAMRPALLAAFALVGASLGCKDGSKAKSLNDAETAATFASAVYWATLDAAPNYTSNTWNGTVVSGYGSGTATLTGSFTRTYNGATGTTTLSYGNVTVQFDDYSTSSNELRLTGTVQITGTCTSKYTCYTTCSGYHSGGWDLAGDLSVSGDLVGEASIYMEIRYASASSSTMNYSAEVATATTSWVVSGP